MKKITAALFLAFILVGQIGIPFSVHAQTNPTDVKSDPAQDQTQVDEAGGKYTYIAPLTGYFSGTVDLRDANALQDYLKKWVTFLIGIGGVIGVVRLVMVGFTIITSAEKIDALSKVRGELLTIIGGLGLVGGSWIFLNTLNPKLVTENLLITESTAQAKFKLQLFDDKTGLPVNADGSPILNPDGTISNPRLIRNGITGKGWYYLVSKDKEYTWKGPFGQQQDCEGVRSSVVKGIADGNEDMKGMKIETESCTQIFGAVMSPAEQDARQKLAAAHVFANKPPCPNAEATSCTNLAGLSDDALSAIINLASNFPSQANCVESTKWNCPVLVNGGTEAGHSAHGLAHPDVVDINKTPALDLFLKQNAEYVAPSFNNNIRYYYDNHWYTDESTPGASSRYTGAHFHVCENGAFAGWWYCNEIASDGKTALDSGNTCKKNPSNTNQKLCQGVKAPVVPANPVP